MSSAARQYPSHIFSCTRKNKGHRLSEPVNCQELPVFVTYLLSRIRAYMRYRETVRELSALTDRELDDLGISRFEIENVVREHVAA